MADTAFQIQYRQEFVAAFEQHATLLRDTVTTSSSSPVPALPLRSPAASMASSRPVPIR
jgi:hypothetical protein